MTLYDLLGIAFIIICVTYVIMCIIENCLRWIKKDLCDMQEDITDYCLGPLKPIPEKFLYVSYSYPAGAGSYCANIKMPDNWGEVCEVKKLISEYSSVSVSDIVIFNMFYLGGE